MEALADNRSYKLSVSNQKLYSFVLIPFGVQRCLSQLLLYL